MADVSPAPALAAIGDLLRDHVENGDIAGAVALVAWPGGEHVEAVGVQDLATGTRMRRDTIFRLASMTKLVIAALAMTFVEEGRIALADPVEPWLPELAGRRVLRSLASPLDVTVPARRPITLDDLRTFRLGLGASMAPPDTYPIQAAMQAAGVAPSPDLVPFGPDEFMAGLSTLPLAHQPGEKWLYHTGIDVLAVLIARLAGASLEDVLRQRILAPLGMRDTGYSVPEASLDRLATCYYLEADGGLAVWDAARGGRFTRPPSVPHALRAPAGDYLAFARMLIAGGGKVLREKSVRLMMRDHLTEAQKAASPFFPGFWIDRGWGFGGAVVTGPRAGRVGTYGWMGGLGTSVLIDPTGCTATILLTQRLMRSADDTAIATEVQALASAALVA